MYIPWSLDGDERRAEGGVRPRFPPSQRPGGEVESTTRQESAQPEYLPDLGVGSCAR